MHRYFTLSESTLNRLSDGPPLRCTEALFVFVFPLSRSKINLFVNARANKYSRESSPIMPNKDQEGRKSFLIVTYVQ